MKNPRVTGSYKYKYLHGWQAGPMVPPSHNAIHIAKCATITKGSSGRLAGGPLCPCDMKGFFVAG